MKEQIFAYDSGGHAGLGLFICRQILAVTGMTIDEVGTPGKGACFVIRVPEENYRIEGTGADAPPFPAPSVTKAEARGARHQSGTLVRELISAEFPVADALWVDYHQTTGDPATDRIFAAFAGGEAVSLARCRRHPDGFEVDAIFTPERHRGHGYASAAVWGLVEACGHDPLYMHSVRNLTGFYAHYGFVAIPEGELPPTIRERYAWAEGDMEAANVCPMRRDPAD
jgi:GNAT superfamily N-acetyltransferase